MTRLLIASGQTVASDEVADIVVIPGDYAYTPVKGLIQAQTAFTKPVVLIEGKIELDGDNVVRRLAEGRRVGRRRGIHFLERDMAIVSGVRFIGMHKPDLDFILTSLCEAHDGPTVIVTYDAPPDDISAVTLTGKVARWIHSRTTSPEALVIDV